jgi:hypothetical protein
LSFVGSFWAAVLTTVLAAGILAAAALAFAPVRARLNRRATLLGGHGIIHHVELDPERRTHNIRGAEEFFFPRSLGPYEGPPDRVGHSTWSWAHDAGGQDALRTALTVTLEATLDLSVVVDPPIVRQTVRAVPSHGEFWSRPPGGASISLGPARHFSVALDEADAPIARFVPGRSGDVQTPAFYLRQGEVERLEVVAVSYDGWHEWTLELPLIVNGKRSVLRVDNGGEPFVTVGKKRVLFKGSTRR